MASLRLSDLLQVRESPYWLELFLKGLQGLGVPILDGLGTATCSLSGGPTSEGDVAIRITGAGTLGTAFYVLSADGGVTWSGAVLMPADGIVNVGFGVLATFAAGVVEPSFVYGDIWSFPLNQPSFAVNTWEPGDTGRTLVELDSRLMEELSSSQYLIAKGGLIGEAEGEWLTLLADQFYDIQRKKATFAVGQVVLTDSGAGPFTLAAGQLILLSDSGYSFYNVAGFTLPLNGTVTISVMAVSPGAASNVATGTLHTLVSVLAGVTANNPVIGLTGTWITAQGTDDETDDSVRARCKAQFPAQGPGSPSAVYEAVAIEASAEVTRVKAIPDPTIPGQVDVYVAGPVGAVSGGAVADVQVAVDSKCVPTTCSAVVSSAINTVINVVATVYIEVARLAAASAEITDNLQAHFRTIPIGGTPYPSAILDQMQKVSGVRNVVQTSPVDPAVALVSNHVATPNLTLTFTPV